MRQFLVGLGDLKFIFKICDGSESANRDMDIFFFSFVNQKTIVKINFNIIKIFCYFL